MASTTQQSVQELYAVPGADYDSVRLEDPRGLLLSNFDIALVRRMTQDVPRDGRVLEAGAGTGRFTLPMIHSGFRPIATDVNESLLDALRARLKAEGVENACTVQNESIFQLSFPDAHFDFIYCLHVVPRLLCFDDQKQAIAEFSRVLKPGGKLLFNYWNQSSLLGRFKKAYVTPAAAMEELLRSSKLKVLDRQGKRFLSRSALSRLPLVGGRLLAACERPLTGVRTSSAWDVFVLAEKLA
jgi:ubiquinone/menaquinone biosynthesis C-methylase UbiE